MFFKGGLESCLKECVDANGNIDLAQLRTTPPSDFHPTSSALLYLTKNKYVARMYAGFAERRMSVEKGAVMQIAIPQDLVSAPVEVYGEDWRDLIWNSRHPDMVRRNWPGKLPEHLQKYETADLLVGPMSGITSRGLKKLSDKNGIEVLKDPEGNKTSQWVIVSPSLGAQIGSACKGFVWITPR